MSTATEYTLRKLQEALEKIDDLQQALSSIAGDQLRVDQVTAADPPFANITLSNLRDRICGLAPEEGNLWGVWDRLNYIKIAIEKLDDLQQALHSIAGDELDVIVESSALPTGAATAAKQDSILTELESKLETADLNRDASGNIGVVPGGASRIFALEGIVEESLSNTNLAAGENILDGTPVPAGEIWVITRAFTGYVGTAPDRMQIWAHGLATATYLLDVQLPIISFWYCVGGQIIMQEGDYMRARVYGATAGDSLYFRYAGYKMTAPS